MKLLIDIDGVVRDWTASLLKVLTEKGIDIEEKPVYDIAKWTSIGKEVYDLAFKKYSHSIYLNAGTVPGAHKEINKLRDEGHQVFFVTNQFKKDIKFYTMRWLAKYGFDCDGIIFTNKKWLVEGDVLIDDCFDQLVKYYYFNLNRYPLVIAYDRSYNQGWSGPRAHNWKEVGILVRRKANEKSNSH